MCWKSTQQPCFTVKFTSQIGQIVATFFDNMERVSVKQFYLKF